MNTNTLTALFADGLKKLHQEIAQYEHEAALWKFEKGISNSAGNLCLHLCGNLNAYIGAILGNTGYVRDRPLEFSLRNIPKATLLQKIDDTAAMVQSVLSQLTPEQLAQDFPAVIWNQPAGMDYTLIRLLSHLNYHLGQINYHRRLLDN
jgi:uncharacterized damage-inducible protein DinB